MINELSILISRDALGEITITTEPKDAHIIDSLSLIRFAAKVMDINESNNILVQLKKAQLKTKKQ